MHEVIETYLRSVDAKDSTRATYRKALECFERWTDNRDVELSELCREDIIAYKDSLLKDNKSALTVNLYLSSLRGFFKWAAGESLCANVANGVGSVRAKRTRSGKCISKMTREHSCLPRLICLRR